MRVSPNGATLSINNTGASTFAGVLEDFLPSEGPLSLVLGGTGTQTLSGNNSFTGGVTINSGSLQLGSTGALNATKPNALVFGTSSTGVLTLNGNSVTISDLNTSPTVGTPVIQNASASSATLTVNSPSSFLGVFDTFAGVLRDGSGGGPLTLAKAGFGDLTLTGNNTFTGGVIITGGVLHVGSTGALNSSSPNPVSFGPITGNAAILDLAGNSVTVSALDTGANVGNYSVENQSTTPVNLTVNNPGNSTFNGILGGFSDPGALSLTKAGAGTLTLGAQDGFTGGVTINAGTLRLGNPAALNPFSPNAVVFGPGSTGALSINGNSVTVSSLTTNAILGTAVVQNASTANVPATLTIDNAADNVFAGVMQDGGGGTPLSVVKSGAGALTLIGANTYTGTTTITAGALIMSGGSMYGELINQGTFVYNGGTFNGPLTNAGTLILNADISTNGFENDSSYTLPSGARSRLPLMDSTMRGS